MKDEPGTAVGRSRRTGVVEVELEKQGRLLKSQRIHSA